jgi:hypothetical protein
MHDLDQKLHAIHIDIVYSIAYDCGKMAGQSAQQMSVPARKMGILPMIQWIRFGTQLACSEASFP